MITRKTLDDLAGSGLGYAAKYYFICMVMRYGTEPFGRDDHPEDVPLQSAQRLFSALRSRRLIVKAKRGWHRNGQASKYQINPKGPVRLGLEQNH